MGNLCDAALMSCEVSALADYGTWSIDFGCIHFKIWLVVDGGRLISLYVLSAQPHIQSTKILLLPSKCEIIFVTLKNFFEYCNSNIILFSLASYKAIALPTIATAIVVALTRS